MSTEERGSRAAQLEAGRAAVRLLKDLAARVPLRSDMPKLRDEIARIEQVFAEEEPGSGAQDGVRPLP